MAVRTVAGRKFGDESEYRAALEDLRVINRLKEQTNMNNLEDVRKLYGVLQSGELRFKTIVGRDFDDEIYDLIQTLEKNPPDSTSRKKLSMRKQETAGNNSRTASEMQTPKNTVSGIMAVFGKKKSTKSPDKDVKDILADELEGAEEYSNSIIHDRAVMRRDAINRAQEAIREAGAKTTEADSKRTITSEEIDKRAKELIRRDAIRRNIIIAVAGVVAVASLGYFILYSRAAYASQAEFDDLAALKGTDPVAEDIEQKPLFTLAEADEIPDILDEYKNIYIKNKSVIGWLTIDDTNIDYPVMQTVNNDYYLDHDFNGKEDKNGSIFLDCNCNAMFRSTNLIIYGHHMKSGKMFGNLKKYESEDYCKEHNIIKFDTIYEKGVYEVMYVFRDTIKDAEDVSFKYYQFIDAVSEEEFDSNMRAMAEMSLYDTGVTASFGDDILTLSTCNGSTSTARFVVVAKRIPNEDVTYVYKDE